MRQKPYEEVFKLFSKIISTNALSSLRYKKPIWIINDKRVVETLLSKITDYKDYIFAIANLTLLLKGGEYLPPESHKLIKMEYPEIYKEINTIYSLRTDYPLHNSIAEKKQSEKSQVVLGVKSIIEKKQFERAWKKIISRTYHIFERLELKLIKLPKDETPDLSFMGLYINASQLLKLKNSWNVKMEFNDVLGEKANLVLYGFRKIKTLNGFYTVFNVDGDTMPLVSKHTLGIIDHSRVNRWFHLNCEFCYGLNILYLDVVEDNIILLVENYNVHGGISLELKVIRSLRGELYESQFVSLCFDPTSYNLIDPSEFELDARFVKMINTTLMTSEKYYYKFKYIGRQKYPTISCRLATQEEKVLFKFSKLTYYVNRLGPHLH